MRHQYIWRSTCKAWRAWCDVQAQLSLSRRHGANLWYVVDVRLCLEGYSTTRGDREDSRADGDFVFYIHNSIPSIISLNSTRWTLCITSKLSRILGIHPSLSVGVIYHPSRQLDTLVVSHIINAIHCILRRYPNTGLWRLQHGNRPTLDE